MDILRLETDWEGIQSSRHIDGEGSSYRSQLKESKEAKERTVEVQPEDQQDDTRARMHFPRPRVEVFCSET